MNKSFEHSEVTIEICIFTHVYNSIGKRIFIMSTVFNSTKLEEPKVSSVMG